MFLKVLSTLSTLFLCINSAINVFSTNGEKSSVVLWLKPQLNQVQYKLFTFNETIDSFNDSLFINQLLYCNKNDINSFSCTDCNNERYLIGTYEKNNHSQSVIIADQHEYEIMIGFKYSFFTVDDEIKWLTKNSVYTKWTVGNVHSGFYEEFHFIKEKTLSLFKTIYEKMPKASLIITGHSSGGSIALLFASYIREIYSVDELLHIYVYTYGSPRVGDVLFSNYISKQLGKNVIRVMNEWDMLPDFPSIRQGYRHNRNLIICQTGTTRCYNKYNDDEHDKNPYDVMYKLRRVIYSKKNIELSHFTYLDHIINNYKCI